MTLTIYRFIWWACLVIFIAMASFLYVHQHVVTTYGPGQIVTHTTIHSVVA